MQWINGLSKSFCFESKFKAQSFSILSQAKILRVLQKLFSIYKPYFKHIAKLSYPIIIGQLGIVLMGVADVIMIGKLDAVNLAAASFANAIYFTVCILGIGTLTAVSPLVAKSKGAGHPNQCAILLRQSVIAALILSVFISIILFLITENLQIFHQTERVNELTKNFLHLLNAGTFPLLIFLAIKQYSDGLSITKPSAVITMIALGINVFLNWVLIYGNLGFHAMGLLGAGFATSFARLAMAVMMYLYVRFNAIYKPYMRLKQHEQDTVFLKEIFKIGLPSGFQYFFELAAFAFAAVMIGWISEYALAAHQIAINIASTTYMIALGISAGGSIAVGDAYGRRNKLDLIRSGNASLLIGAMFMGCCAVLLFCFKEQIVLSYITDKNVTDMAVQLILIAAFFQLSDGIQCVGLGILRGIGDTKMPTAFTIFAYWAVAIPVGYWLGFVKNFSLYGIWIGLLLGLTISAIFLSLRFIKLSRKVIVSYQSHLKDID